MFPPETIKRQQPSELARIRLKARIGRWLHSFLYAHQGVERINDVYRVWLARSPADRLSDLEIERYSSDRIYSVGNPETAEASRTSSQGMSLPFVEEIISTDPSVRTFLNVGVYVGNFDHLLAKAHPQVQFLGVDFWSDVHEANAPLLLPNFKVTRGYALDMLEAGEIAGDIVHFCATATRFKEQELRRYLRVLKKSAKYVVFNEPLFPLPDGRIPDPTTTVASWPILTWPIYPGDKDGGYPPCLCHNYARIASEEFGEVLHQSVIHKPNPRVFVVAKVR
jgi:hypothetical protein